MTDPITARLAESKRIEEELPKLRDAAADLRFRVEFRDDPVDTDEWEQAHAIDQAVAVITTELPAYRRALEAVTEWADGDEPNAPSWTRGFGSDTSVEWESGYRAAQRAARRAIESALADEAGRNPE